MTRLEELEILIESCLSKIRKLTSEYDNELARQVVDIANLLEKYLIEKETIENQLED